VLKNKNSSKVAVVLCGNKCDLIGEREVSEKDARALADKIGCPYFETSAKEHINVDEAFEQLVREVRIWRKSNGKREGGLTQTGGLGMTAKERKKRCRPRRVKTYLLLLLLFRK